MNRRTEPRLGFTLHLEPRPGFTAGQGKDLERRIADYAEAHEIEVSGHQLSYVVHSSERSLTASDQVDLIDWLIDQPGMSYVCLSPLLERGDRPVGREAGFMLVSPCDHALIGLTLLYRCRRVSAELYLQILGGFVRQVALH